MSRRPSQLVVARAWTRGRSKLLEPAVQSLVWIGAFVVGVSIMGGSRIEAGIFATTLVTWAVVATRR